eukprot:8921967-Pyramimonas_sp.AAC.1
MDTAGCGALFTSALCQSLYYSPTAEPRVCPRALFSKLTPTRGADATWRTLPTSPRLALGWAMSFPGRHQSNASQCSTGPRGPYITLSKNTADMKAKHHDVLKPTEDKSCSGNRERAQACKRELAQAAQHTPEMQSLIEEAVQIAKSFNARGNNSAGLDLDGPAIPREGNGSIKRPPSGGLGCPACTDN